MSALPDDLEADLVDHLAPGDPRDEPAIPLDQAQADWQLRRLALLRRDANAVQELAANEITAIREWERRRLDIIAAKAEFYERNLTAYHAALLEADPKAKTVFLPAGTLKSRRKPDGWDVDDDTFGAWAKENAPDLVRVRVVPDKPALKKAFGVKDGQAITADGEVVPGVVVTPGEVQHWVDTEAEAGECE